MEWLLEPRAWIALLTLTALEIVLGIDNIIFISILVGRLPVKRRQRARILGLALAVSFRLALLLSLTWVMKLTAPLFFILTKEISGRDIILLGGGLFLLGKSTSEIHKSLEGAEEDKKTRIKTSFISILMQIALLDMIFSLDSVITAIGVAGYIEVMIMAIILSVIIMMVSSRPIGEFVDGHPTIKMLALSFLILIGVVLVAEGLDFHIPRGYIYFALAFSFFVEMLNLRVRKKPLKPAKLHKAYKSPSFLSGSKEG